VNPDLAPVVHVAQERPSGLASMLGDLIAQNLARDPGRIALLVPATSAIEAEDVGIVVTIELSPSVISLVEGTSSASTVRIRASSADLLALVSAPLRFGLPDVMRPEGRSVVAKLVRGQVSVRGLLRHPRQVARLTMLLSVSAGPR
jgi:hypothetical protein